MIKALQLFQYLPENWPFQENFLLTQPVYEWIAEITQALRQFFLNFPQKNRIHSEIPSQFCLKGDVFIGEEVRLPPFGYVEGPAYIGNGCELRSNVYIRGNVIAGKNCVLGHACEFKNALLLDDVQVPHFNYVGDSILGNHTHLGAGCILSNLRFDRKPICMRMPSGEKFETGLKKLGGILGDYAEAGCNAVLQPGACLFPYANVWPCESFSGTRLRET